MALAGYHGGYFRIDVGEVTSCFVPIPDEVLATYLGGVGLGTWVLLQETVPFLDPFDRRSPLVLAFSPLVGTPLTTSAKFAIVAKSLLTQRINDSLSSSHFAIAAKKAGGDAIALGGRADDWSVLVVDAGEVGLRDAHDLLGLSARETERRLRDQLGADFSIAAIGPAGENQVRYATISLDGRHAGRGGLGAVLGSKRIKAIAVRGDRRTPVADPARVVLLARELSARSFGPATQKYRELGSFADLLSFNRLSALPARNFQPTRFDADDPIESGRLALAGGRVRKSCAACTIGCEKILPLDGKQVRVEHESLFALGSLCGVDHPDAVLRAAALCDEVGIDTISFGGTFAFACECVERGLLAMPADVDLRFGSQAGLLDAVTLVSQRQGIGNRLAEGSRRLSLELGPPAPSFAPHVKGLEIPGYEPRRLQAMALGFAVGSRGADHNRSGAKDVDNAENVHRPLPAPELVRLAVESEDKSALFDSLILCKFLRGVFSDFHAEAADILSAITGRATDASQLRESAQRIVLLKRFYNQREGWSRSEDTLPDRFLDPKVTDVANAAGRLSRATLDHWISLYYRARGLDEEGRLPAQFFP